LLAEVRRKNDGRLPQGGQQRLETIAALAVRRPAPQPRVRNTPAPHAVAAHTYLKLGRAVSREKFQYAPPKFRRLIP
jgi:hypothetical protein